MSAPNTDPNQNPKRHRAPLFGMSGGVVFVAILIVGMLIYLGTSFVGPTRVAPEDAAPSQSTDSN